jgi:hypothetical protein
MTEKTRFLRAAPFTHGVAPLSTHKTGLLCLAITIPPGVLAPPVLADGFRRFVQPIRVSQQSDQFDVAKEFHRVRPGLAQRPQFPRADENTADS